MNYNNLHPDELKNIIKQCQVALQRKESNETIFIKENPNPNYKIRKSETIDYLEKWNRKPEELCENFIFKSTLEFKEYQSNSEGTPAYIFTDTSGKRYSFNKTSIKDLFLLMKTEEVYFNRKSFTGYFTYNALGQGHVVNTSIYKGKLI